MIRPAPLGDEEAAEAWLEALRRDGDALADELDAALRLVNKAVHAHRSAVLDPSLADVSAEVALGVRVGFGTGEDLAEGRFTRAIEVPSSERRRRRFETLRPQERVAAVLGDRESVAACEPLLLRARADLDAGRSREATLQLRVGLEALLADRDALRAEGQAEDLAALGERRTITGEAANEALGGELTTERTAEVSETLRLCERVLRRRRAFG